MEIDDKGERQPGNSSLKNLPKKWYTDFFIVEFDNETYKLAIRNNPVAEHLVSKDDKELLAYGLVLENKELKVRIATPVSVDVVFYVLLWYLFFPIATENFGDI